MKRFFILFSFVVLMLSLSAQETDEELGSRPANNFKPMIFVCSASNSGMEIKIGDDDNTYFTASGLTQYSTTALTPVDYVGFCYIYFKHPGDTDWTIFWDDTFDIAYEVDLEPGQVLGILLNPDDYMKDVSIDYYPSHKPQIMFANLSDMAQYNLEAGSDFGKHDGVWFDELHDYYLSDFKRTGEGYLSIYWQTRDIRQTEQYNYYPDADGDVTIKYFDTDKWYMVMTYDLSSTEHRCKFIDVSPTSGWIKN